MTKDNFTCYANQYMDMVFRLAFNYLKNRADAEDVTQNVLLKLYQSTQSFESDENVRSWLIRVTINECKSIFRLFWRTKVSLADSADPPIDADSGNSNFTDSGISHIPEDHFVISERASDMLRALMQLPVKYRVTIYLYYYEEYDTNEIADLLQVPAATIRTRLARGRDRLRRVVSETRCTIETIQKK